MENKIKTQKGFIHIPLLLTMVISMSLVSLCGCGGFEYYRTYQIIEQANDLSEKEKYNEAIERLESIKNSLIVTQFFKEEISNKISSNEKRLRDKSKFNQALDNISKGNYQEALNLLLDFSEDSFYFKDVKIKIEEAKRKVLEEELGETKIAKEEAEEKAQQETVKRSQAEEKAQQEEFEKNLIDQQLSEKETEEKKMNTDNDDDGLTYRRELELGTSDFNFDSDGDGIKDGEDAHPAGGGRYLAQNFEWEYEGNTWTWDYSIQEDWYEYYKSKTRTAHGIEYVTPNDPFIKQIAEKLKETSDRENYHLTSFILSFVQNLPYMDDSLTGFDEYPKYPIETFVERNGDCEDTSYLFASLVQAIDIGTALVQFHNHMGVGIKTVHSQYGYYYPIREEWYYYYETTNEGWIAGELPDDYLFEKAKIIRVSDNNISYSYPQRVKLCVSSPDFYGYYYDIENNYYSDNQCNNLVNCIPYGDLYKRPQTGSLYWDNNCTQIVIRGCSESVNHPGYFTKGNDYYSDSLCTQKASVCRPSPIYSGAYWDGFYHFWDSACTQKI